MRFLLFTLLILVGSFSFAADEVYLVGGGTYLDDYNQTISPELGLQTLNSWAQQGAPWLTTGSYLGEGFISLLPDASGNVENGYYTEYRFKAEAKVGQFLIAIQDGVIWSSVSNRDEFNSWDDKLSVQVAYKLK